MNSSAQASAQVLGLDQHFLVGAADGEDQALASLDLVGRGDPQAIVGDPHGGEKLDGKVPLGRIEEKGDDPKLALGTLDDSGPDLRHFHGNPL